MSTISIQEIQSDPVGFLRRVEDGETFFVVRGARPLAEVKPIRTPDGELRPFGFAAGCFSTADDFDRPLPDDILQDFEGR
jgi:antitoxin (DNA-binding transcriptional repressor) of toxin-antitoxin stability system